MATPSRTFRTLCLVVGCYLAFACAVQFNDPDAPAWVVLYGAATLVTFVSAWRLPPYWVPAVMTLIAMAWAVVLMPYAFESSFPQLFATWTMMSSEMEVGREFLGLMLLAIWMAMLTVHVRQAASSPATAAT